MQSIIIEGTGIGHDREEIRRKTEGLRAHQVTGATLLWVKVWRLNYKCEGYKYIRLINN